MHGVSNLRNDSAFFQLSNDVSLIIITERPCSLHSSSLSEREEDFSPSARFGSFSVKQFSSFKNFPVPGCSFSSKASASSYKANRRDRRLQSTQSADRYHRFPFRPPFLFPLTTTRIISHRQLVMSADGFANVNSTIRRYFQCSIMKKQNRRKITKMTKRKCFLCFGENGGLKNQKNIPPTVGIRHRRHTKRNKGEGEGVGWPQGRISD